MFAMQRPPVENLSGGWRDLLAPCDAPALKELPNTLGESAWNCRGRRRQKSTNLHMIGGRLGKRKRAVKRRQWPGLHRDKQSLQSEV